MRYQFTRSVKVDGKPYAAGDIVRKQDVPTGYFESCVRVGHLVEVPDEPAPAAPPVAPAPPKPPAKK